MKKPVFALLCLCCTSAFAQGNSGDSLSIALEMQGSFSNSKTPLWLNANKYGLSSLTASNGYVRGIATYNKDFLDGDLDLQVGADVALPVGYKIQGYNSHYCRAVHRLLVSIRLLFRRCDLDLIVIGQFHIQRIGLVLRLISHSVL